MLPHMLALGKTVALCAAVLLATSSAQAQTSPSGHVPARRSNPRVTPPPFNVMPGDHMFQATMKIQHNYQYAEQLAPVPVYRPRPWRTAIEESARVDVASPEGITEMVTIRGPDGKLRSFPIVGGRKAIKARTIIVRPGQRLNLRIQGGHVEVSRQ